MDVSVIIVNYNTKKLTSDCVASVVSMTSGVTYEIILVDNASTDGSLEEFQYDERVRYIRSDVNLGFGRANNLGYRLAQGKYLFLLNSDTILLNNAIKEFYCQMESRGKEVGCMGCFLVNSSGYRTHSFGKYPTINNELLRRPFSFLLKHSFVKAGFDVPLRAIDDHSVEVEYVTGADLFVKREVADKLGLFDPDFFMYYEETEMQWRYRKNGFLSIVIDTPQIMHLEGGSRKKCKMNLLWRTHDIKSMVMCYRKIHGNLRTKYLKVIMALSYIPFALFNYEESINIKYRLFKKLIVT